MDRWDDRSNNFGSFAGLPREIALYEIAELCRDSSGHADLLDALEMAAMTGYSAPEDHAALRLLCDPDNEN